MRDPDVHTHNKRKYDQKIIENVKLKISQTKINTQAILMFTNRIIMLKMRVTINIINVIPKTFKVRVFMTS